IPNSPRWRVRRRVWALAGAGVAGLGVAFALLLQSQRDPGELRRAAARALQVQPFEQALGALGRFARLRRPSAPGPVSRAEALAGMGRVAEALEDLASVSDSDPLASRARFGEGHLELWRRHRSRAAEPALLQALALEPRAVEARRDLIRLYDIQGRLAER